MTAFNVLAYNHHDPEDTHRREIPHWNLHRLVEWVARKDFDVVLIEKSKRPPAGRANITHHVCCDPDCPGGC